MENYDKPLTLEQQRFAEENHDVIYSFMRYKHLSYDYYDIIVFGYLRAVRKYLDRPELRQYSFKTIANYAMNTDLCNYYRKQSRKKRKTYIISLDTAVYGEDEHMTLMDIIAVDDTAPDDTAYSQLLDEISAVLSREQLNIIQMKSVGYNEREIAKKRDVPVQSIQDALSSVRELLYPLLV